MKRRTLLSILSFLTFFSISLTVGQNITGTVFDESGVAPLIGAELSLKNTDFVALSNASGKFTFYDIPEGNYKLIVNYEEDEQIIDSEIDHRGGDTDLGKIMIVITQPGLRERDIAIINLDDLEVEDDAGYSVLLTASRDPFENASRYNLSSGRFRIRGYDNENTLQYINGIPMNDFDDGRVLYATWGGLNDVFRASEGQLNMRSTDFSYGGIGGATNVDLSASAQRPGTKLVYTEGNRSYRHRAMITHSSGMQENGWAYSLSASHRWGNSGYIEGTHFEGSAYFASIDKRLNDNHLLNLVILGSPQRRGRSSATTQEAYDLAGSNFYNPNWGYQNGEIRNSREYRINQPVGILKHDWSINGNMKLNTSLGIMKGTFGSTGLDWLYAADPRADYYKKLPSYYEGESAEAVAEYWREDIANRQLNWDEFYRINRNRNINVNGREENISAYIVQEQHYDNDRFTFNSVLNYTPSVNFNITTGLTGGQEKVHNYNEIVDLLGGEHYLDVDDFAERDFPDNPEAFLNNLDEPYKLLEEGDRLGHDYDIVTNKIELWSQAFYNINKVELFGGFTVSNTSFYREGFVRNGRFPDNSQGKSETQDFTNFGAKLGVNYKFNGRNFLYGIANYRTRAPFSRFAYISPRTRDQVIDGLTSEKILSAEGGYIFKFSGLSGRLSAYYTTFEDQVSTAVYYHDELRSFVNYIMTGIDKRHSGLELSLKGRLYKRFTFQAAGAIGKYIYTSRPTATIIQDNSSEVLAENKTVYLKNYYFANGPQDVGSFTLEYEGKQNWFLNLTLNYFDNAYLSLNPDRRTTDGVGEVSKSFENEHWNEILNQTKLDSNITLDLFGRKSFRWGDNYYMAVLVSVNNILNNKEFITGGFEQYRYDYENNDVNRFPPRLYYAFGTNYSVTVNFSF